jgi:hypothetical protein
MPTDESPPRDPAAAGSAPDVVAVDLHPPFAAILEERARARGLSSQIDAVTADMTEHEPTPPNMNRRNRTPTTTTRPRRRARVALLIGVVALVVTGCRPVTPPPEKSCTVGILGDSLTLGAERFGNLTEAFRQRGCTVAWVDAATGRRTSDGVAVLEQRNADGQLPYALVVGLGTNDEFQLAAFGDRVDRVMELANGRKVAWIDTSHLPVRGTINRILAQKAREHPDLTVIGWNDPYWANPSWRATDDIHATRIGYVARADMMADHAQAITK